MRKLILVPLAAAICMSMSACPKTDMFEQSERNEIALDQKVDFEYQVQDGNMVNGYVSGGNALTNTPETKPQPSQDATPPTGQTQPPAEATTPSSNAQLVGTWSSVSRQGNYLIPHTIDFKADGTFYEYSSEYTHTSYNPQLFAGFEPGWKPLPMGFPGWYGTYTVSGNTVTQITTGDDIGSVGEPSTNTLTIDSLSDDTAVFNGQTYLKNFTPSNSDQHIEELCAALGVDLSV